MSFITGWVGLGTGLVAGVLAEPAGTDYQRQFVSIPALPGGVGTNDNYVSFGPTVVLWGTLTTFAIFDQPVGGTLAWSGALASPVNPPAGTPLVFQPGGLSVVVA